MKIAYKTNGGVYIVNTLDGSGIPEGVEKATGEFPDMFFRQAWDIQGGNLVIDLQKAKDVAHQTRRHLRELEFEPYDERITGECDEYIYKLIPESKSEIDKLVKSGIY